MYAQKKFEFRADWNLLANVRESIMFHRCLAMKSIKTYDQVNEDKFEDLLTSVVQVPAADKKATKKQMLMRQSAWCLMLGVDHSDYEQFGQFASLYQEVLNNNPVSEDENNVSMK